MDYILFLLIIISAILCAYGGNNNTHKLSRPGSIDTHKGSNIKLKCRFDIERIARNITFRNSTFVPLWKRIITDSFKLITFNNHTFESYKLEYYSTHNGLLINYDLIIDGVLYERDNALFECILKESGNVKDLMAISYFVTVLIPPGPPKISPSEPIAKEGEKYQLVCSSKGGSPDPSIEWTKDGKLIEGERHVGGSKDLPTMSILNLEPNIDMDQAQFMCSVHNRAMNQSDSLSATITLNVHYAPRITVGKYNPLIVSEGQDAHLFCETRANPQVKDIKWQKGGEIVSLFANHIILNVGPADSGVYTCMADNGINDHRKYEMDNELTLNVQYGPRVQISNVSKPNIGESMTIKCLVDSDPKPYSIMWIKQGDTHIYNTTDTLHFDSIDVTHAGKYFCIAKNLLRPSGSPISFERFGNASVIVRVKYAPRDAKILPPRPVAISGFTFTLTCASDYPGWPEPTYIWWKKGEESKILSYTQNYTFTAHISFEGQYFCQPSNNEGKGPAASVNLTVQEAPSMIISMQPEYEISEDEQFTLTCKARGKPRPSVSWYHNKEKIVESLSLYRDETIQENEDFGVTILKSILHFERQSKNGVRAEDKGNYTCVFDNKIGEAVMSHTVVHVKHSPIVAHTYNKVAFDVGQTAVLECKMSAFPEPTFKWLFAGRSLDFGNGYITNVTKESFDLFVGTLMIRNLTLSDYGTYTCQAKNMMSLDGKKTNIQLLGKSRPEAPKNLEILEILSDSVTLRWDEGFDGGLNTEFNISYSTDGHHWINESCRSLNPCQITRLESRKEYRFKVLAINTKGRSPFSNEQRAKTKVDIKDMPNTSDAFYDSVESSLTYMIEPTSLELLAKIEAREGKEWSLLTTSRVMSNSEKIRLRPSLTGYNDMRIILCLQSNETCCGNPNLVKMDPTLRNLRGSNSLGEGKLTLILCLIALVAIGSFLFFCCFYKKKDKNAKKDYEMESDNNRVKVSSMSPPYYSGHDNKGLVNGSDDSKLSPPPMYNSNINSNGHVPQNYYLTGDDAVPSPSGTNETNHSEVWMMKNDGLDIMENGGMGYHCYGSTQIDPNGYPMDRYAYYPQDEYQPLSNDNYSMNVKNCLYSPYYDDGMNAYGTTQGPSLMNESLIDPAMLSQMDIDKMNNASYEDEPNYGVNRSTKVIKEIIV